MLEFTWGRGIRVTGTPKRSTVLKRVRDVVEFARSLGYRRDEIVDMITGLP